MIKRNNVRHLVRWYKIPLGAWNWNWSFQIIFLANLCSTFNEQLIQRKMQNTSLIASVLCSHLFLLFIYTSTPTKIYIDHTFRLLCLQRKLPAGIHLWGRLKDMRLFKFFHWKYKIIVFSWAPFSFIEAIMRFLKYLSPASNLMKSSTDTVFRSFAILCSFFFRIKSSCCYQFYSCGPKFGFTNIPALFPEMKPHL